MSKISVKFINYKNFFKKLGNIFFNCLTKTFSLDWFKDQACSMKYLNGRSIMTVLR